MTGPAPLRTRDFLVCALGAGLLAGLLEAASHFIRYAWFGGTLPLGWFTLWLPGVANAGFFLLVGLLLALVARARPGWLTPRRTLGVLLTLAAMAALRVLDNALSTITVDLLALGIGLRAASWLARRPASLISGAPRVMLALLGLVLLLGAGVVGGYHWAERRALARLPAAPAGPNVLLLVLDTVRRLDVSAFGYERPTTPALSALAQAGVRFPRAVSPAPWTLPSHASLLTGRWAHELSSSWATPLNGAVPTLAEVLSQHGYRTAGIVANVSYTGRNVGLGRGFAHYEDVPLNLTQVLRSAAWTSWLSARPGVRALLRPWYKSYQRKTAPEINAAFLRWLDRDPARPWFAFLNYFDAHEPYLPAAPFDTAFGDPPYPPEPPSRHGGEVDDDRPHSRRAYDQAIATLDHGIGALLDSLRARGTLDRTLVVVTSDHGEEFGEHGLYGHGHTLNLQALEVGAILAWPEHIPAGAAFMSRVSLRDVPATVLDLAGLEPALPGKSLARFWLEGGQPPDTLLMETRMAPNRPAWDLTSRGDLQALITGDLHFIRHADGTAELYDLRTDSLETDNLMDRPDGAALAPQLTRYLDRVLGPPGRRQP